MSQNAHDYVLVIDRSAYFRSLLKESKHAQFEIEWIKEFVRALRCRDESLNAITTITIVVYAGKAKYASRYVPGSYAAGSTSDLQHYWEFLKPTLLNDLTDKNLERLAKKWVTVTSKLYVEEYGNLNLVLQDLSLDGFIRIKRVRYSLFLRRLSLTVTTSIKRIRVLIVITGGRFNHVDCQLDNPFRNHEFSGLMKKKSKSDPDAAPQLAWKSNSCIVSKAVQYAYDYVYINVVGKMEQITMYIEQELKLVWSQSIILKLSFNSFDDFGYTESVYKILAPCKAITPSPTPSPTPSISSSDTTISVPSTHKSVKSSEFPPLLVIAIDESDSFNRNCRKGQHSVSCQHIIRDWVNSLLRQGKARPKFEKFKAIVARFSGLNVKREENEIGSQVFANHKHVLYHYEFAPQNRNGTLLDSSMGHPYIEASEIEDDTDIFDPVSEELDGNSQIYLCLRDICHYIDNNDELDMYNKVLLVISDMGFDGIGDVIAENRPLKDEDKDEIDFSKMKEKLENTFLCNITDRTIFGLQVDLNDEFEPHPNPETQAFKNLNTVFDYQPGDTNPENLFHASFQNFQADLDKMKDKIADLLFECLDEGDDA